MNVSIVQGENGIRSLAKIPRTAVVIIDVFRASTTMTIVLEKGARCIIPVKSNTDALELKEDGHIIIGEENGLPPDGFDHGNSPWELSQIKSLNGKIVIMKTTNGTRGILAATKKSFPTYVGCFRNARILAEYLRNKYEHVILVPMGTHEKPRIEDDTCAEILKSYFLNEPILELPLIEEVRKERLEQNRHIPTWKEDVSICLELNTSSTIPYVTTDIKCSHQTCIKKL